MHLSLVRAVDCAPHNRPETCFANDHQCGQGASRPARKHPPGQQKSSHEKLAAKAAGFGDPQICNERIWGITFGACRRPRGSSAWTPRCLGIAAWRAGRPGPAHSPTNSTDRQATTICVNTPTLRKASSLSFGSSDPGKNLIAGNRLYNDQIFCFPER